MTDSEEHSTYRVVGHIKKGYHVLAGERWLRVEDVDRLPGGKILLTVRGGTPVALTASDFLWSRDPAEQFYAVSAALPMLGRIRVARGTHLGNPFNGSRATPITECST